MRFTKSKRKCLSIILLLSLLIPNEIVSRPIMAAGDDFASATPITEGEVIQDAIDYEGNEDYYVFTPSYTGCFTFSTTGTTDTYGLLYNSDETLLTENDDSSDTNFAISYDLIANQDYYIQVCHAESYGTGDYGLIVENSPKYVYGTAVDIENAQNILGYDGYTYTVTDDPEFVLPEFADNDIILGGPETAGGVPDVPLNGAIRFEGADRYLTAQAIADYLMPKKVYGNTTDVDNARNILGEVGFRYIYTDEVGYELPAFSANDIIVGGPGATGGVPDVELNGASRLFGDDAAATAAAITDYGNATRVYGATMDLENAQMILGDSEYIYLNSEQLSNLPVFCANNLIVGSTVAPGGVPDIDLRGAIRLDGTDRYLTAQKIADYAFPKNVYGNATDVDNARAILGEIGFNYIYSDEEGFELPTFTPNDIIVGSVDSYGGIPNVSLNGAIRLEGESAADTQQAINDFSNATRVYGAGVDLDNAKLILGDTGYVYIHTEAFEGSNLPVFCSNNLIVGGSGSIGGVPEVSLNGATRLAGADRFLTAQKIEDYKNPKNVYGNTTDIENARGILGEVGFNYIYTDEEGFVLPTFTLNDIIVGGAGATGGVPDVELNGAIRLSGADRTATAAAVSNFSNSRRVYGTGADLANAQKIFGTKGYVYIDTSKAAGNFPEFCPGNIIVGGPGAIGGVPSTVTLNEAVRLSGDNRDLTEQAIYNYAGIKDIPGESYGIVNRTPAEMMVAITVDGTNDTISIPKDTQLRIYGTAGDYYDCYYPGTCGIKILKVYVTPVSPVSSPSPNGGYTDFLVMLALHESSSATGGYGVENQYHYLGRYQMGESALIDANFYYENPFDYVNDWEASWTTLANSYGVTSKSTFLNNAGAQEKAIIEFHKKQWQYIQNYSLDDYIGQTVHGVYTTASGILAVTHLVGIGGAIQYFNPSAAVPKDGNGTPATVYMQDMGGCDLSKLLGYNPDGTYTSYNGSGNVNTDKLIAAAYGEVGYQETPVNITKYGAWYGDNGVMWCAEFVSWCANQAGILNTVVPKYEGCYYGQSWYQNRSKLVTRASGYIPKAGDVVFFGNSGNDHTGIVIAYDPTTDRIYTIEGNYDNAVKIVWRPRTNSYIYSYGKNGGTTYGAIPNNSTAGYIW